MVKYGLVLEGGGMRAAYTAGCLKWLLENDIKFDNASAISATAVLNAYFIAEDVAAIEKLGVELMSDKHNVGVRPFFTELQLLGYNYMFKRLLKEQTPLNIEKLRQAKTLMQFGVYCKEDHQMKWVDNESCDEDLRYLKASVVLPVGGRSVKIAGKHYLDGGVMTMMPIFHAQDLANDRFFCITTKHESYVRTPNSKLLSRVIDLLYWRYPKMRESIKQRVAIYYQEIDRVTELVAKKQAIFMRPSVLVNVSRLSATKEDLVELFNVGYQDCQKRKAEIYEFFAKNR